MTIIIKDGNIDHEFQDIDEAITFLNKCKKNIFKQEQTFDDKIWGCVTFSLNRRGRE